MNTAASPDITRTTLTVLIIGVLIVGSLWTLLPFIGALIWATAIVVATWPLLLWVQRRVGGRRSVATTIMVVIISIVVIVPFWVAINALLDASTNLIAIVRSYLANGLGPPPSWLASVPFAGERLTAQWSELAAAGPDAFAETIRPYARTAAATMVALTGGIGGLIVHFLLTVILVGVLYAQGETAAQGVVPSRVASEGSAARRRSSSPGNRFAASRSEWSLPHWCNRHSPGWACGSAACRTRGC